jgi:RNA polymerase sigma-70 factor (ECF subfamily)
MAFNDEFERFYKKQYPALLHFARYLINSNEDALEIVNDVFVAVWNKRDKLQLNDSLKSYLFTSVKNSCINFQKKNRLKFSELTDVDGASDYKADEGLEIKELNNDLDKALSLLPPKCKQVFLMSRVDGLKYQQIADVMDISIKTVEAQMSKALKIFKNNLKRE